MNNPFKQALAARRPQIGLWLSLAHPYAAEVCATAGFQWLLIDGEHAPNDVRSTLAHLQAVAPYPGQPVVRAVTGDTALIKQLLDIGVRNLLVPMVDTPSQARALVAATRYPPEGVRGVGAGAATWTWPTAKSACWCRPKRAPPWTTWRPSAPSMAWTACSSVRPTWPRRWALSLIHISEPTRPY